MTDLRTLYQEIILDHYKRPRNFRVPEGATCKADGYNPLCGDQVTVYLVMDGERVADIAFEGSGCAISTASASLMTEAVKGRTREHAEALLERFHDLVTSSSGSGAAEPEPESSATSSEVELGKLEALAGVRDYPVRIKCATLPWHAMRAALRERGEDRVSTE
jgi:nitrogen fixation NifU-like protein